MGSGTSGARVSQHRAARPIGSLPRVATLPRRVRNWPCRSARTTDDALAHWAMA